MAQRRQNNRGCFGLGCIGGCLLGLLLGALALFVACGALVMFARQQSPTPPLGEDFSPDPQQAVAVEQRIDTARQQARDTNAFNLSMTEREASSWLNLNVPQVQNNELGIENVQVLFRNGEIQVYGERPDPLGITMLGGTVGVNVNVRPDGKLDVSLGEASFGGIDLPQDVRDSISQTIQDTLNQELNNVDANYFVNTLRIQDGQLVIDGGLNQ